MDAEVARTREILKANKQTTQLEREPHKKAGLIQCDIHREVKFEEQK